MKNLESFDYGGVYHVYSHANAQDLIFKETSNYQYFLEKLSRYIIPVADVYAYSLLPNHFHLLLRFKDRQIEENEKENIHKNLMKPFSNMLNGYAKAYNKRYNRKGALFLDFIKRKKVEDEKYLLKLVHYIHHNPVNHGFVRELNDWNYSSYRSYLDLYKKSQIKREDIMEYFDSIQDFIAFHHSSVEYDFLEM